MHEASMYEDNSFLTLTYNNENLPKDKSVSKVELQKFMKRLRRKIEPTKVRFFGCGEYGEKLGRPHYHLCLFNYDFDDKEVLKAKRFRKEKFGTRCDILYTSDLLGEVWRKGFHTIGDVTLESAGYVARYVTKKVTGKKAPEHYQGRTPEFALMSRGQSKDGKGGIGKPWFDKYYGDIYPKDYFTVNGSKHRPSIYYDNLMKKRAPETFNEIKERRKEYAESKPKESSIRQMQREKYRKGVTQTLERTMENGSY